MSKFRMFTAVILYLYAGIMFMSAMRTMFFELDVYGAFYRLVIFVFTLTFALIVVPKDAKP